MIATLPSGLILQVRGLTGKDGRYLANEKLVRDEEIEDYVFSNTCTEVVEEGVYSFGGKPIDWSKILIGDRTVLTLDIRVATYPDESYVVPLKCIARTCRKSFEWEIDIEKLLRERTQALSVESRAKVKAGEKFEFVFPSTVAPGKPGRKAFFTLKTGGDAKRYAAAREHAKTSASRKTRESQNDLVNGFLFYTTEIEGIERKDREARQAFFEELPMRDLNAFQIELTRQDCGIDTTIEVECPYCETAWEIELPFGRELFAPADPDRRAKRARRLAAEKEVAGDDGDEK